MHMSDAPTHFDQLHVGTCIMVILYDKCILYTYLSYMTKLLYRQVDFFSTFFLPISKKLERKKDEIE